MKGKKLKVAFVDDKKQICPINETAPEELAEAIKELIDELLKRLGK